MHVDIPQSQIEQLNAIASQTGKGTDELVQEAVSKLLEERRAESAPPPAKKKSLLELFEPLRGLDMDFSRNPSIGRPFNL